MTTRRPAAFRIPLAAFLDLPRVANAPPAFRRECKCGAPCFSTGCGRCYKRAARENFLAKWECRYSRDSILDAMLEELGWSNRNYDFSEERDAFAAALDANADPEEFRRILAEGGLDGIIEERDRYGREWRAAMQETLRSRGPRRDIPVPALAITSAEAKTHATELLKRPRFWSGFNSGRDWAYQDEIYLQVLCIAGTSLEDAAQILGRPATAIAWRASDGGLRLPKAWRVVIASTRKRKPSSPRWVPMAYPFVSKRRTENAQLMEVNGLVAEYLPGRADICQEIMLVLWEGKTTMVELRKQGAGLRSFVRQFYKTNYEASGYARSLDAPLTPNSEFSLMDTLSN